MTPEQRAEIMAAFTDAEQSMAWHAARGLDTTRSSEMVNDLGEKVAHLQATRNAALARAEAAEAEAARLREALEVAAVRFGICAGRMRACHSETGNHELLDEVEAFDVDARALLAVDRGAVLGDDSRESSIAHKWARAAFTLAHFENDTEDTAQLKQAVRDFWAPMDYSKDEDEIMRVAILLAIQEVRQRVRRERED